MTELDREIRAAIDALVHRLTNRTESDDEPFAMEFIQAMIGRGWRPTPAKTTTPPLHAPPVADKRSRDEELAVVRAEMAARAAARERQDGAA